MPLTKDDLLLHAPQLNTLVVIGEDHNETDSRAKLEREFLNSKYGTQVQVFQEYDFPSGKMNAYGNPTMADCIEGRTRYSIHETLDIVSQLLDRCETEPNRRLRSEDLDILTEDLDDLMGSIDMSANKKPLSSLPSEEAERIREFQAEMPEVFERLQTDYADRLGELMDGVVQKVQSRAKGAELGPDLDAIFEHLVQMDEVVAGYTYPRTGEALEAEFQQIYVQREKSMLEAANLAVQTGKVGVWKIGELHLQNLTNPEGAHKNETLNFQCVSKANFDQQIKAYECKKALAVQTSPKVALQRRHSI